MTVARTPVTFRGFTASTTITATNASWSIPALSHPIAKLTVIGGGGGGTGSNGSSTGTTVAGGAGGTSSVTATGINVTAAGGLGGNGSRDNGDNGTAGNAAANGGSACSEGPSALEHPIDGRGGAITVAYVDLTGLSTLNITIGAGGTGGDGTSRDGGTGGRGEVIVEYAAF